MSDVTMSDFAPSLHPHPTSGRPWSSLDGRWDLAFDTEARHPDQVDFDQSIEVPFASETPYSGVGRCSADTVWYRRSVDLDAIPGTGDPVIHLLGVDRVADVWIDGYHVAHHRGGYGPFETTVPDPTAGRIEIAVRAHDPADDLSAPRGKQDWNETPHGIWYPRTTGIWKSVWAERRPATWIDDVEWIADISRMTLRLRATVYGRGPDDRLRVMVRHSDRVLVDDVVAVGHGEIDRVFPIGDGGFDDRHGLLWWPSRPIVLDAALEIERSGTVLDRVTSYTAMRSVGVINGRFVLNGRPFQLRMVLDQGYWPETGATPPDPEALRRDIELAKALGFNTVRRHQKTEDPRFFELAARLGLMVWVEMPSAFRSGRHTSADLITEWSEVVVAHRGHPAVVAWVPINESWGVEACSVEPTQRATIVAMRELTNALDGTRPVSANDGWETVGGDIVGVHDYDQDPAALHHRWGTVEAVDAHLCGDRPDGRLGDLDRSPAGDRAVVLSEFGGTALVDDTGDAFFGTDAWGYADVTSPEAFLERYRALWRIVHDSDALAGACWTQLTDTYQEVNGLLRSDRTPKADVARIRAATTGRPDIDDEPPGASP